MGALSVVVTVTDAGGNTGTATVGATITDPALFAETFDGLAVGAAVSTSNTAFASVSGSLVAGGPADRWAQLTNAPTLTRLDTPTWAASAKVLASQELTLDSLPDAAVRLSGLRAAASTTGAGQLTTAGKLQVVDNVTTVGTSTGVLATGVRYKVEHFADSAADTQTIRATRISDGVIVATVTGAYSGPAPDSHRFGFYTAATVAAKMHNAKVTAGADWVPNSPPPAARPVLVGASSNRPSTNNPRQSTLNLEAALRAATGQPKQHLFVRHTYNGATFPSTLAATLAAGDPADGYKASVINVKCDWSQLASGVFDSRFATFLASIPAGYRVYLIANHEPENDGRLVDAPTWCAGQARAASVVAGLNDDRLYYAICNMVTTWYGSNGGQAAWADPVITDPAMTVAVRHRTVWAPDGYCQITNTAGTTFTTPSTRFDQFIDWCTANDVPLRAVSENALNNDIGAPQQASADWQVNQLRPWLADVRPEYYLYYESPGPAAGGQDPDELTAETSGKSPYLNTAAEQLAYGQTCLQFNYE